MVDTLSEDFRKALVDGFFALYDGDAKQIVQALIDGQMLGGKVDRISTEAIAVRARAAGHLSPCHRALAIGHRTQTPVQRARAIGHHCRNERAAHTLPVPPPPPLRSVCAAEAGALQSRTHV
jgi:hypothetical protein